MSNNNASLLISVGALILSAGALYISNDSKKPVADNFGASVIKVMEEQPEEVAMAMQRGMMKKEEDRRKEALSNLGDKKAELFDNNSPYYLGNKDGDVVFVEFFDYNCGFCKRAYDVVEEVVQDHPNVKIVLKEFPILGPSSELASRAALAAEKQDAYQKMHVALLKNEKPLQSKEDAIQLAESIGLDGKKLGTDMDDPSIDEQLANNVQIALALGIQGTPGFISEDNVFPGMISKDKFAELVQEEMAKNKTA